MNFGSRLAKAKRAVAKVREASTKDVRHEVAVKETKKISEREIFVDAVNAVDDPPWRPLKG